MTAYVQYLPQPFFFQVGVKYLTGIWEIGSLMHFCEKFDFIILASKQKVFFVDSHYGHNCELKDVVPQFLIRANAAKYATNT